MGQCGSNCPVLGAMTMDGVNTALVHCLQYGAQPCPGSLQNTEQHAVILLMILPVLLYYPVLIHLLVMLPCPWSITVLVGCTVCVAVSGTVLYLAC